MLSFWGVCSITSVVGYLTIESARGMGRGGQNSGGSATGFKPLEQIFYYGTTGEPAHPNRESGGGVLTEMALRPIPEWRTS